MEEEDRMERVRKLIGLESLLEEQRNVEDQLQRLKEERIAYIKGLPEQVQRKIRALKKLLKDSIMVESKFYEEIHTLSLKLHQQLKIIHEKRKQVIEGSYEPQDDELYYSDSEEQSDSQTPAPTPEGTVDDKIPDFWLTVLKSSSMTMELIQPQDEPVLQKLTNVEVIWHDSTELKGFSLVFYFAPNEYFTNEKITKTYTLRFVPDESDPFSYDGPEISKCKGTHIDWHKGKNITVKTVKKKQKHKGGQMTRTVVKSVGVPSFFNFFSPPIVPSDPDLIDEDTQALLNTDFEIGYYMKDRLIPRAILYYTGEAQDDDDSDDDDDDDEYEEDSDDDIEPEEIKDLLKEQNRPIKDNFDGNIIP